MSEVPKYINPEKFCNRCNLQGNCGIPEEVAFAMRVSQPRRITPGTIEGHLLLNIARQNDRCLIGKYIKSRIRGS